MTSIADELNGPDPSWQSLYRAGCVCVPLFLIIGMLMPFILLTSVDYDTELNGANLLQYIGQHRLWWLVLQNMTMGSCAIAIIPFMALYPALKHANKSYAAIGVVLAISCQILFLTYLPIVNGLLYLSDEFVATLEPLRQQALVGGAEALVAQNNVYGPSDGLFALSIFILSLVMLKSTFPKAIAYLGIVTAAAGLIGAMLKPLFGILYLWWWLFFVFWFIAIAVQLYRLGFHAQKA